MINSEIINKYKPLIDKKLQEILKDAPPEYAILEDAMKYSLSIGGKRIRPCLLMEFANICGGDTEDALNLATAIECIHTYSLIHDDLPCMDNDDMRRGKPSCHKKFGEDIALLAGDALLTFAFSLVTRCKRSNPLNIIRCVEILSAYSGKNGMIGGQVIDLQSEGKEIDNGKLLTMYTLKTSMLLQAACYMGCIISGATGEQKNAAYQYGKNLGIAFQIVDDILDVTSTTSQLGKPVGSDQQNQKSTYVSINGLENAKAAADEYTNKAIEALEPFKDKADALKELTLMLCKRTV